MGVGCEGWHVRRRSMGPARATLPLVNCLTPRSVAWGLESTPPAHITHARHTRRTTSQAKGYVLGCSHVDALLALTYQLAAVGVRDALPPQPWGRLAAAAAAPGGGGAGGEGEAGGEEGDEELFVDEAEEEDSEEARAKKAKVGGYMTPHLNHACRWALLLASRTAVACLLLPAALPRQ